MGFSGVQWWEEWQLRLLVLASLFLQCFLFVAALLRKCRVPQWFRFLIWLAYQGSDFVVIYALATLFNRHEDDPAAAMRHGSARLGPLWAPILLLHLGGQDGFTAYSVEDNENWRRQLFTAVSQIIVAIYVFRKSWWSDDGRLLRATILLFVPGILKCLEKPWALKKASITSIMNSPDRRLETTLENDAARLNITSLNGYLQAAAKIVNDMEQEQEGKTVGAGRLEDDKDNKLADEPYHLFVDLSHPYTIRLKNLEVMLARAWRKEVHGLVRASLSKAFDRLYTNTEHKKLTRSFCGGLLRAAVGVLTFVGVAVFQGSRRSMYDHADVVVTYVLLCCTAALEFITTCVVLCSGLPSLDDQVSQYSLIEYLAHNKRYRKLRHLAGRLGCRDLLDQLWGAAQPLPEPSLGITKLVCDHVADGWKDYIKDTEKEPAAEVVYDHISGKWKWYEGTAVGAYRRLNDSRGQRTLAKECAGAGPGMAVLWSSLRMPFDESVLVWHLATEFCYFEHVDTGSDAMINSRIISNYMAYLLFVNPEMLMPGARCSLIRAVSRELQISECKVELEPTETKLAAAPVTSEEMARQIIRNVRGTIDIGSDGLVHKAWELAYELMEFATAEELKLKKQAEEKKKTMEKKKKDDENSKPTEKQKGTEEDLEKKKHMVQAKTTGDDKMWAVIQGVWVEMLCFSAGRCRGYLHAKSLGKGGEYLSYVWLLLSYMGMETVPERMQRPELPVDGDTGVLIEPQREEMAYQPAQKTDAASNAQPRDLSELVKKQENQEDKSPAKKYAATTTKAQVQLSSPTATASAVTLIVGDDNVWWTNGHVF